MYTVPTSSRCAASSLHPPVGSARFPYHFVFGHALPQSPQLSNPHSGNGGAQLFFLVNVYSLLHQALPTVRGILSVAGADGYSS